MPRQFDNALAHLGRMPAWAELAARCGISVRAVDVAVHRLRRRYGELLRAEIAHTVSQPDEVEEEIRYLMAVLWRFCCLRKATLES